MKLEQIKKKRSKLLNQPEILLHIYQIEKEIQPDVIHLHSSVAGGLGRLAYKEKNNTVVYTPHGYAHILMGAGKKSKVYKFAEKVLGNRALTLTCCESEDEERYSNVPSL